MSLPALSEPGLYGSFFFSMTKDLSRLSNSETKSDSGWVRSTLPSYRVNLPLLLVLSSVLSRPFSLPNFPSNKKKIFILVFIIMPDPHLMRIYLVRYSTSAKFGKNPKIFT